jgi:hypothetical protein
MNDHTPIMAFWILKDGTPLNKLFDKTFGLKYHHNLAWDRHFISGGRVQR